AGSGHLLRRHAGDRGWAGSRGRSLAGRRVAHLVPRIREVSVRSRGAAARAWQAALRGARKRIGACMDCDQGAHPRHQPSVQRSAQTARPCGTARRRCTTRRRRRTPPRRTAVTRRARLSAAGIAAFRVTDALSLLEGIERLHPEPYRNVAPEVVRRQAERAADVEAHRDLEIVELMRLAALVGERNGHTGIFPWREQPRPFGAFPIRAYEFEEGTFVVAAVPRSLVGCELVAIAGVPLVEVMAAVSPLIPHDNEWTVRERRPRFIVIAEVLRGLGVLGE